MYEVEVETVTMRRSPSSTSSPSIFRNTPFSHVEIHLRETLFTCRNGSTSEEALLDGGFQRFAMCVIRV